MPTVPVSNSGAVCVYLSKHVLASRIFLWYRRGKFVLECSRRSLCWGLWILDRLLIPKPTQDSAQGYKDTVNTKRPRILTGLPLQLDSTQATLFSEPYILCGLIRNA